MGRNRDKIKIVKKRKVDKIMEEKKVKLSTVIIFLLLIVIIAGGMYIYTNYKQKRQEFQINQVKIQTQRLMKKFLIKQ